MAQILEYIKIALMNIRSNKGRSFLTMLGIIIGISSVILIYTVGNGVKGSVNGSLDNMIGSQIYFSANRGNDEGIEITMDYEDMQAIMAEVDHVTGVFDYFITLDTITNRRGSFEAYIYQGTPGMEKYTNDPICKGRYFTEDEYLSAARVCIMTEKSARALFGTTDVIGMNLDINLFGVPMSMEIIGIRQDANVGSVITALSGDSDQATLSIEVPDSIYEELFGYKMEYYGIYVVSDSAVNANQVAEDTLKVLELRHDCRGKNAFDIQSFADYMSQINSVLDYITIFVMLVATISLLVGGIGVMNIMLVSVTERTREIGIRKALGARTSSILLQFLSESAIITLMGGIIGIVIGIAGAYGVCALANLTAKVSVGSVIGASGFSAIVGLFFGIYPARKAAKLSPIEALRHE